MRRKSGKVAALLATAGLAIAALAPAAASADPPKFNPGQKGNLSDAPGPNANPHCVPG